MPGTTRRLAATCAAAFAAAAALASPAAARSYDDPALPRQWGLALIGAPAAWDTTTGAGTVIAVLDSGVDLSHEDLKTKLLPGRDFTGNGSVQDDCGHGSHVSGIAAGATGNGRGIAGVAPDAKILPVKVLEEDDGDCVGSTDAIADAIRWSADQGVAVINLSLGSDVQFILGSGLGDSLDYAWSKGSIPVIAAGNQFLLGSGYTDEPAIVVTATGRTDQKPSYSSTTGGARWSISAPGGNGSGNDNDVLSAYFEPGKANSYALLAGTSMATPHVAGAAALLRSLGLTPQQTVDTLLGTAKDLGSPGTDNTFGAGRLDVARAVATARPAGPATTVKGPAGTAPATTTGRTTGGSSTSTGGGGQIAGSGGGSRPATSGTSAPGSTSAPAVIVAAPLGDGTVTDSTSAAPPRITMDEETSSDEGSGRTGLAAAAAAAAAAALVTVAGAAAWAFRARRARPPA